jgi:hypothetical protein
MSETGSILARLRSDFEFYAPRCLKILTKDGNLVPFALNRAQRYIHQKLEEQRERTGKVRAIVLKGRQQGASTYIGGRFYWRSSGEFGKRVQILTHEIPATQNLFRMTKRYHDNCPAVVKPSTSNSSTTELVFDKLDTRYGISTAGSQATGRSATAQFFHGSEVAFWPHAEEHMAGIGQIVPDQPDTEIILESTANGIGNLFHALCMRAMRGRGDFILIFVPWFWEEGYRRPVGDYIPSDEDMDYQAQFGLDDEQMAWRANKIESDFKGDVSLFNQEYPATVEMAFQAASGQALIAPAIVSAARHRQKPEGVGPLILTLDPAEYGDDDSAFVLRRGRLVYPIEAFNGRGPMELVGMTAVRIEAHNPDAVCIDVGGGYGRGIIERLSELGFKRLYPINFGETAMDPELYANRRAEMWGLMRDWLRDQEPYLPDDDVLAAELSSVTYHYDSARRLVLTSKEKMRADGIPSPDRADALALTFSVRVADHQQRDLPTWRQRLRNRSGDNNFMTA